MKSKAYWYFRKQQYSVLFRLKKLLYILDEKITTSNQLIPIHLTTIKTLASQSAIGLIIVFLFAKFDTILLNLCKEPALSVDVIKDVILGGMGMAGVILGLYCANVTSIFSVKYSNAPQSIANAFKNDIVTSSSTKRIIRYIIICTLLLIRCISKDVFFWPSIILFAFLTIHMVISFSISGNRAYALSSSFKIADLSYISISRALNKLSKKPIFANDVNFQNHLNKVCRNDLSTIHDIAKYNSNIPKNQNDAMLSFAMKNLLLINHYWKIKPIIPYDSKWFSSTTKYMQWHAASSTEINIAIKSAAPLNTYTEQNTYWFEEKIYSINHLCVEKMLSDLDFKRLSLYFNELAQLSSNTNCPNELNHWVKYLTNTLNALSKTIQNLTEEQKTNLDESITSSIDILCVAFAGTIASIYKSISELSLNSDITEAIDAKELSQYSPTILPYINNTICKKMYQQIEAEEKIEGRKITPNWIIEQTIAQQIHISINEQLQSLTSIIDTVSKLGKQLYENKQFYSAAIVFAQLTSMFSRCKTMYYHVSQLVDELEAKHLEPSTIWAPIPLSDIKNRLIDNDTENTVLLISCCANFAFEHWENREDAPDLLGFCYNNTCEQLIQAIEDNNINKFTMLYRKFLHLTILYQEYIRTNVIKHTENHLQDWAIYTSIAPFKEFSIISGLSIIWGEFLQNPSWLSVIERVLEEFIKTDPKKNIPIIHRFITFANIQKQLLRRIGSRDTIQTEWNMRIAGKIMQHQQFETSYTSFGQHHMKTKSSLLDAFINPMHDSFIELEYSEEVYYIICINKYLDDNEKYSSNLGWENELV